MLDTHNIDETEEITRGPHERSPFWPATRDHALTLLNDFLPRAGGQYASKRNYDFGPEKRMNVSNLSPFIRRRMITEKEVVDAVLERHSMGASEKFIQEVFWRTYWKGWLELRPQVWRDYKHGLQSDLRTLDGDPGLRKAVREVEEGRTGLAYFDDWVEELVETGYLHNHTRMWFASIWVFTLKLPWRIGADFFHRHLLDGDAASNTLSWRWVAGLHTKGKNYAASDWNIEKFTAGRYHPLRSDLAKNPAPLVPDDVPPTSDLVMHPRVDWSIPTGVLMTDDDLHLESMGFKNSAIKGVLSVQTTHERSPRDLSPVVASFDRGAFQDAHARLTKHWEGTPIDHLEAASETAFLSWVERVGVQQIVCADVPVGPNRDWIYGLLGKLKERGVEFVFVRRTWDEAVWPHATAGFFKVKKQIPNLVSTLI